MSASLLDWPLASAEGLLTDEECSKLLDIDLLESDDLLKAFPTAASKIAASLAEVQVPEDTASLYPPTPLEVKPTRAQLANDLLQQIENQHKQENIFSNWLEEKVELPIFEIPQVRPDAPFSGAPVAVPVEPGYQQPTEELLREFETVYGAVELTHLTPPQSPPGPAAQLLMSYAYAANAPQTTWNEYDRDLSAVDQLVHDRAVELLPSPAPVSTSASSRESSPPSSPRSSDEEWCVPTRGTPYSRPSDDRRSRKKEQNKNAATRYRQKKKQEVEVLLSEEATLRQRHGELGSKCTDLQREIRYLKGLMRDLFKAKGLIK